MSLRATKKQQTRAAILESAETLIAGKGFDATTMEEVAAAAVVSVGTLYNYFGSKQALLVAVFEDETEAMLAAGAQILASPEPDARAGVGSLFHAYSRVMLSVPKSVLREVLQLGFAITEFTDELASLDYRLMAQLAELIDHYRAQGRITAQTPTEDAVYVLYSIFIVNLIVYVSLEAVTPTLLSDQIASHLQVAFNGLEPRDPEE